MAEPDPTRPPFRLNRIAVVALALVALVSWSFAADSALATVRVGLFLVAAGAVVVAFGRHVGPALVVVGVMALGMHRLGLDALDAWALVFAASTVTGTAVWLRPLGAIRWVAASAPCWALASAHPFFEFAALAMAILGLGVAAVGPTLPGRRVQRAEAPLAHLANGPLVPIAARTFAGARWNRWLSRATWAFAALAAGLGLLAQSGWTDEPVGALALGAGIIAVTFALSNWFTGRLVLRIDHTGLHARTLVRTTTIRWPDVAGLTLRYVWLPASGMRLVYFVVYSPTREFAFLQSIDGAADLQATIEAAIGLRWPEPEFTSTL